MSAAETPARIELVVVHGSFMHNSRKALLGVAGLCCLARSHQYAYLVHTLGFQKQPNDCAGTVAAVSVTPEWAQPDVVPLMALRVNSRSHGSPFSSEPLHVCIKQCGCHDRDLVRPGNY